MTKPADPFEALADIFVGLREQEKLHREIAARRRQPVTMTQRKRYCDLKTGDWIVLPEYGGLKSEVVQVTRAPDEDMLNGIVITEDGSEEFDPSFWDYMLGDMEATVEFLGCGEKPEKRS